MDEDRFVETGFDLVNQKDYGILSFKRNDYMIYRLKNKIIQRNIEGGEK